LQVLPVPSPQELARLYEEDYWAEFRARWGIRGGDTEVAPQLKLRLREIESRLATGRLLDLGCAMGHFVAHARDQGWEAIGVEPSVAAAEEGRRRYGVTIHNCVLEAAPIPPASQDVVHSNHVIEHLPDPVGTLRTAFRMLRPGGILVAEVPQELATPLVDRILARLHPELYCKPPPPPSYHLVFFTPRGLTIAAGRAGFEVLSLRSVNHTQNTSSRLPLGSQAKGLLYWLEEKLMTAPNLVLFAARPAAR